MPNADGTTPHTFNTPTGTIPDVKGTPTEDVDFYYPTHQDPSRRLPGGAPYLDDVQRRDAEIIRAKVEGRKPDLDNPPAVQGTQLLTAAQISTAGNTVVLNDPDVTLPVAVSPTS